MLAFNAKSDVKSLCLLRSPFPLAYWFFFSSLHESHLVANSHQLFYISSPFKLNWTRKKCRRQSPTCAFFSQPERWYVKHPPVTYPMKWRNLPSRIKRSGDSHKVLQHVSCCTFYTVLFIFWWHRKAVCTCSCCFWIGLLYPLSLSVPSWLCHFYLCFINSLRTSFLYLYLYLFFFFFGISCRCRELIFKPCWYRSRSELFQ